MHHSKMNCRNKNDRFCGPTLTDEGTVIHFAGTHVRILDVVGGESDPKKIGFRRLYLGKALGTPWMLDGTDSMRVVILFSPEKNGN